jgi:hypothetical protein
MTAFGSYSKKRRREGSFRSVRRRTHGGWCATAFPSSPARVFEALKCETYTAADQ